MVSPDAPEKRKRGKLQSFATTVDVPSLSATGAPWFSWPSLRDWVPSHTLIVFTAGLLTLLPVSRQQTHYIVTELRRREMSKHCKPNHFHADRLPRL